MGSMNAFEMLNDCDPKQIAKMSEKIINAFINCNGGTLYFGIDKTWKVLGVKANDIDLNQIKHEIMCILKEFQPKIQSSDLKKFKVSTVAILTKDGMLKKEVIIIKIVAPSLLRDGNSVYATAKGEHFKKNLGYIMKVVM